MKLDTTKILKGFDGKDIKVLEKIENEDESGDATPFTEVRTPATVRFCCKAALLNELKCDQNASLEKKLERYNLAMKIHNQDEIELSSEQVSMLKKRLGLSFGVVVVGRCCEILDPIP